MALKFPQVNQFSHVCVHQEGRQRLLKKRRLAVAADAVFPESVSLGHARHCRAKGNCTLPAGMAISRQLYFAVATDGLRVVMDFFA